MNYDIAAFHGKVVHRVCSTYVLSREMEWAGRLFVLEMRDEDEEGIGTMIEVKHEGPAFPGDKLLFRSQVISIEGNELMCRIDVETEDGRMVARGRTGQKILPREKIRKLLSRNR
ncbi:MAG: hypothetical protein P8X57_09940 [Cyclobacteriaceae bacterium]